VSLLKSQTALRQAATQRGRQYELGQVQAGTMSMDLTDVSEYLNPVNASSPWNSGGNSLLPYRSVQLGAYWNAATKSTTGNLFNAANTPAYHPGNVNLNPYDPSFETSLGPLLVIAGPATLALSTAQKFDGAQSAAATFTATTDVVQMTTPSLPPGTPVTLSVYVFVPAGTTLTVTFVNWPAVLGATIGTASSTVSGAWQRLTVTGTPSTPTCAARFSVTGTVAATVYVDALQLEFGSTASAFTTAGPKFYAVFTGYVERYPQTWDSAGFRGLKPLDSVDALSPLSRAVINQSYASTVLADAPAVFIPFNEASAPQVVQRPTGGQQMIGYTELGSNSGAVNFGGDSFLDGSRAVAVVQQNKSPVVVTDNTQVTYIGTRVGALSADTASFTLECWAKITTACVYFGVAAMQASETTIGAVIGPSKALQWFTSAGRIGLYYTDPNGNNTGFVYVYPSGTSAWNGWPDGKWHHLAFTMKPSNSFDMWVDGQLASSPAPAGPWSKRVAFNNFYVEAQTYYGDPVAQIAVANMAAYPTILTSTQFTAHYQRGIGYLGELAGTRANRLLTQFWSSNIVTDPGKTQMGTDFAYNGQQLLGVLQGIADTEGGLLWVDAAGKVHFDDRGTRYVKAPTAQFTFGENAAGGELPYTEVQYDYDPTYVYSEADLTAPSGVVYKSVNATSQTTYGQRILSKTMQMANDWDVAQAANFYTRRYAAPAGAPGTSTPPRISKMTISPSSNPNLFTAALTLDIGSRVTVKRRTSPGVTITGDYYIEQVSHHITGDPGTWTVDYQMSPVFVPQTWKLADAVNGVLGSTTVCVY
jgi:hypothetical protein